MGAHDISMVPLVEHIFCAQIAVYVWYQTLSREVYFTKTIQKWERACLFAFRSCSHLYGYIHTTQTGLLKKTVHYLASAKPHSQFWSLYWPDSTISISAFAVCCLQYQAIWEKRHGTDTIPTAVCSSDLTTFAVSNSVCSMPTKNFWRILVSCRLNISTSIDTEPFIMTNGKLGKPVHIILAKKTFRLSYSLWSGLLCFF